MHEQDISILDYESFDVVAISGWTELDDAEKQCRLPAILSAFRSKDVPSLDLSAVNAALEKSENANEPTQCKLPYSRESTEPITPALDAEEERKDWLSRERSAYEELLRAGCFPCYEIDDEAPLHIPSTQCQDLIDYWRIGPPSSDDPLGAQLKEWQEFCNRQADLDPIRLTQSQRLCLWEEYENMHQIQHEILEATVQTISEAPSLNTRSSTTRLKYATERLKNHQALLEWISQKGNELAGLIDTSALAKLSPGPSGLKRKRISNDNQYATEKETQVGSLEIPVQSELVENPSKKPKHESPDTEVGQITSSKRWEQSLSKSINQGKDRTIQGWCITGVWPKPTMATGNDLKDKYLGRGTHSVSEASSQDSKIADYKTRKWPATLKTDGYHMHHDFMAPKPRDEDMEMIEVLLSRGCPLPLQSRFDDDKFEDTCFGLQNQNAAKIVRHIRELIFPGPQHPAIAHRNKELSELVGEVWIQSNSITGYEPRPDVSVGFNRNTFTEAQLAKLGPYIGLMGTEVSIFAATYSTLLPFISGEVRGSGASIGYADNHNSNSMFFAARAIVSLFCLAGRDLKELDRKILAFSVSHNDDEVRIHAYYPSITEGAGITYHRHLVKQFLLQAENGKEKWTAFTFVSNMYQEWVPKRLEEIRIVLDELPPAPEAADDGNAQNH